MTALRQPYVGPRAFTEEDGGIFFGRKREAEQLLSLVLAHPVTLLYSPSGAGKTSLLHAGLIPKLQAREDQMLGVARVKGELEGEIPQSIANIFLFNALTSLEPSASREALAGLGLRQYLAGKPDTGHTQLLPPFWILLFDQFEEIFTSYPAHWEQREAFFEEISAALLENPNLRVLFAMREEYIASLDSYARKLPEGLQARFRLEPLRQRAAVEAIEQPLEAIGSPWRFAEGAARKLVENLRRLPVKPSDSMAVPSGEFIEPLQLQLVCRRLWQSLPAGSGDEEEGGEITEDYLQEYGDVEQALAEYYEGCVREVVKATGIAESKLRSWLGETLITPESTRELVRVGAEIPPAVLELLAKRQLVRVEVRGGGTSYYELIHDRFIQPIRQSNRKWQEARRYSKDEVEELIVRRAFRQSEYRRLGAKLGQPSRVFFKFDTSSNAEEIAEDYRTAELVFALEVLEREIHLARGLEADSYPRLEKEWLSRVERLKAYLIWEEQGAPSGGIGEEHYYAACESFRKRLAEPRVKAAIEEFDPFEEYLRTSYLDARCRLDKAKTTTKALLEGKAHRIYHVAPTGNPDSDMDRAREYAERFYDNIVTAIRKQSETATLAVLEAFRFSKRPENRYLVINCFEAALGLYFLDPQVVLGLWEKGRISRDATL